MATEAKTHKVKITVVPEELLRLLDDRFAGRHYGVRAEYLRELIRRDLLDEQETENGQVARARSVAEAVFRRIEMRDTSHVNPPAPGADSR